jgi:YHS domain-containing protein
MGASGAISQTWAAQSSGGPIPDEKEIHAMDMERSRGIAFAVVVVLLGWIVGIAGSAVADPDSLVPAVNAAEGIGLKGYDPVAYFINRTPTQGKESYTSIWKGVTYRFASAENLAKFKADPEKYLPQYGGYCAYAMSLNRIADIDPSRWAIVDGKLYLNNGFVAEKLWSLNKNGNIVSADRNWPQYPKNSIGR